MNKLLVISHFLFAAHILAESSLDSSETYNAAVVEYSPLYDKTDVYADAKQYLKIINSTDVENAEIIIFPECTLNSIKRPETVPKVEEKIVPCGNVQYGGMVQAISCAAKTARKYVVINLYMQRNCRSESSANDSRPCTRGDINIYNTAVVFDRNGMVVAIYRKHNLYLEDHKLRRTLTPDVAIFDTDFGVRFGLIICFDLTFQSPIRELIEAGVRNLIYQTMWFSALPFNSALQIQQSRAFVHNINLLASGASIPMKATTGSGFYSGHNGAVKAFISDIATTKILVATMPKIPGAPMITKPTDVQHFIPNPEIATNRSETLELGSENLDNFNIHWLNFVESATQIGKVCQNGVCCNYNASVSVSTDDASSSPFYSYIIAVFDNKISVENHKGNSTVYVISMGVKSCSLIACTTWNDRASCGKRINRIHSTIYERYTFQHLQLSTHLPNQPTTMTIMPNTVDANLLPLNTRSINFLQKPYEDANGTRLQEVILDLELPTSNILTFSIYVRDHSGDSVTTKSNGNQFLAVLLLIVSSAITTLYLN